MPSTPGSAAPTSAVEVARDIRERRPRPAGRLVHHSLAGDAEPVQFTRDDHVEDDAVARFAVVRVEPREQAVLPLAGLAGEPAVVERSPNEPPGAVGRHRRVALVAVDDDA